MQTSKFRLPILLALAAVTVASWSLAEPRRRPGAPAVIPPPPDNFAPPPPVAPPGNGPPNNFAPPPPVAPSGFAPPPAVLPSPPPTAQCTAILSVRQTVARPGCTIDERVTRAPGVLTFPCGGGPATANFGGSIFNGAVQNGVVTVSLRTAFHFSDGCNWQSVQSLTGSLASRQLAYIYNEGPLPGQSGCANACEASGVASVQ